MATVAMAATPTHGTELTLGAHSAIPGQAVTIAGPGITGRSVTATVGGKRARVVAVKTWRALIVPATLKPGRRAVVVRTGRGRLRGMLKIVRNTVSGTVRTSVDSARDDRDRRR